MAGDPIAEGWVVFDALGMLQQVGAVSPLGSRVDKQLAAVKVESTDGRHPTTGQSSNPARLRMLAGGQAFDVSQHRC